MKLSKRKKAADDFMKLASHAPDRKTRKLLEEMSAQVLAGDCYAPPRRRQDCKTFEDACRYVFKVVQQNPDNAMVAKNGIVERIVWFGRNFSDKHVALLEE